MKRATLCQNWYCLTNSYQIPKKEEREGKKEWERKRGKERESDCEKREMKEGSMCE